MKEWNNQYNPFNSYKVLLWREHLDGCAKFNYLPPVTVDIDPSNRCNFKCGWCNAKNIITDKSGDMTKEHMIELADFLGEWGVKSTCVAGGGEPFMNKNIGYLFERLRMNNLEIGVITNGSLIDNYIDDISKYCKYIGISIDSANTETFQKVKGIKSEKIFHDIMKSVIKLRNKNKNIEITYKYLIHKDNYKDILDATKLAKEVGFTQIHFRPAGVDNLKDVKKEVLTENEINVVNEQLEKSMGLETKKFKVYGIRHKFNQDFSRKNTFKKCLAIPILPTFSADGNVYICFDRRGDKNLVYCIHDKDVREVLNMWNTKKHHDMIKAIDPINCPRCTFTAYNEMIENVIIKDKFCRNFP